MSIQKIILTHGAGASTESIWFKLLEAEIRRSQLRLNLFDFEYMEEMKKNAKRRPPSRFPKLVEEFNRVLEGHNTSTPLVVGGKSMGGRVATQVSSFSQVRGVVIFGFPFHAVGKEMDDRRVQQLLSCEKPVLIFQGTKDKMGNFEEVSHLSLPSSIEVQWVENQGHDLVSSKDLKTANNQAFRGFVEALESWCGKLGRNH